MASFQYSVCLVLVLASLLEANAGYRNHHTSFISNRFSYTVTSRTTLLSRLFANAGAVADDEKARLEIDGQHLFRETNVVSRKMPVPHAEIWKRCFGERNKEDNETQIKSPSFWETIANSFTAKQPGPTKHGVFKDAEVVFYDDPSTGARELLEKCGILSQQQGDDKYSTLLPETMMKEQETLSHLTNVLSYYQTIVSKHDNMKTPCRARIVCTVGSMGTKCPRWHADHVPVRLVMSLVGPGCQCIPFEMERYEIDDNIVQMVNRHALNNLEDDDTSVANELIVPTEKVKKYEKQDNRNVVICASAGDAVLLMGRGWEDQDSEVLAAVHRSPILKDGEERILLTVDVADWDYSHQ